MKKVSCVFLSLALVLLLIGCGANRKSAQSVVEDAIDAVKSADQSVATGYWGDGISNAETDESDAEMLKAMFGGISYNVISSEDKGDSEPVQVEISNNDIASIMGDVLAESFSKALEVAFSGQEMSEDEQTEMMNNLFIEKINSGDYGTVEKEVDVSLSLVDDEWVINPNQTEAIDAMTGGMLTMANGLSSLEK